MSSRVRQWKAWKRVIRVSIAVVCFSLLVPGEAVFAAGQQQAENAQSSAKAPPEQSAKLPPEQLDSLVAPIALYPDSLLSQTLMASTYPLEIVQLQQWLNQHKDLKDKALADAVAKQPWDASVQAMASTPEAVKRLADDIKWTTDLGNAFLAQQSDVMDAVQRMRAKAEEKGNLKSTEQQKVETKTVENKQVIVVQPSNPEVVYVPTYNPTVVYGPPPYPYPAVYYPPPPPPGYYAAGMAVSFGVGVMMGAFWSGGSCCGCGWGGHSNVYINNNNTFVRNNNAYVRNNNIQGRNTNIQGGNRVNARGNTAWQHNPQHRGGTPYADRNMANRYGGTARGESIEARQANARQNQATRQSQRQANGGQNQAARQDQARQNQAARQSQRQSTAGAGQNQAARQEQARQNQAARHSTRQQGGGDRIGNQSVPRSTSGGAFGGGSGASSRASSARGASSFSGRSGARAGGRRR